MTNQELFAVEVASLDGNPGKITLPLPGEQVVNAFVLASIGHAGFDDQFLATEFGGVVENPIFIPSGLNGFRNGVQGINAFIYPISARSNTSWAGSLRSD